MTKIKTSLKTKSRIIEVDNPSVFDWVILYNLIKKQINLTLSEYVIKINLIKTTKSKLYFNLISLENFEGFLKEPFMPENDLAFEPNSNSISCLIIPTGIGASFGGYAGDANPIAKLIASSSKYFIANPNVVNGAVLTDVPSNLIYLEGFLLEQFLLGKINLMPTSQNNIGVIFDKGISDERLDYELNVLNAAKAFYGCNVMAWTQTDVPILISPSVNNLGFSTGSIKNIEAIIDKAFKLKHAGATAIAICCAVPDISLNASYQFGKGVDPIGGVESIISHSVSAAVGLVSAHAPILISDEEVDYKNVSPASASEYIAQTFLPSVISGLRFSPRIVETNYKPASLSVNDLFNIIVPYNAFGSAGVLFLNKTSNNLVSLVAENKTCLEVNPNHIAMNFNVSKSYKDLIDIDKATELGIDPSVLERPLKAVPRLNNLSN